MDNKFNIRVYGLVINDEKEVLLADEYVFDTKMTKFPGGGLEFGEGAVDCIKREAVEEFGQEVDVIRHYYTTHFYQKANFFHNTQLLSIYYLVKFNTSIAFKISDKAFDYSLTDKNPISFRWRSIQKMNERELSFPIDKYVLKLLKNDF